MVLTAAHAQSAREALETLKSDSQGLSIAEASARLLRHGPNALPEEPREHWIRIFARQFASPLIFILVISAVAVFLLGDVTDAVIIFGVLLFNALIGAIQEGKAQRSLEALKKFTGVLATVRRGGKEIQISDAELVPGDIIIVREGERISADARVLTVRGLQVDEAAMTGESLPVRKSADTVLAAETPVADRRNMVYRGTSVLSGSAVAMVVATGSQTVIGGIAKAVVGEQTEMPLKASIRGLSRGIMIVVGCCLALLFVLGALRGMSLRETFTVAVSLAVSVIPEGLPIVITIILATGVWRMAKRQVLVRKLQAVEALGQATVIAVDKTGTITKNEMMVQRFVSGGSVYEVGGSGYKPGGEIKLSGKRVDSGSDEVLRLAAEIATAASSAEIVTSKETGVLKVIGDPTEAALGVFGVKAGVERSRLPVLHSLPFSYQHKFQVIEMEHAGKHIMAVVGAPEVLLKRSVMSEDQRKVLEKEFLALSDQGLRVVACAVLEGRDELSYENVQKLSFVGVYAMSDTIRKEAPDAVDRCAKAGLTVVMMTGDHARTAVAIARTVGIFHDGDAVLEGSEIERMSDRQLEVALSAVTVFARVTPEHKLRIVRAYRHRGEVVAMTGDGVNDVPSIVAADLGVAMGKIGTEVTKSAADIVILDDNFGSIVHGVEEGRHMYVALRKVTMYLLSTSLGEMLTILVALAIGLPLPILAAQIIWLNLITDTFLDISLAMEPKEASLLEARSRPRHRALIDQPTLVRMGLMALPMAIGTLVLFASYADSDLMKGWTMSLTTLAVFQWFNALNCRSETRSIFMTSPISNRPLLGALTLVIGLQIAAVYHPLLQKVLKTVPLSLDEWKIIVMVAASIVVVEEIRKLVVRNMAQRKTALV